MRDETAGGIAGAELATVLLVDDDPTNIEILKVMLAELDCLLLEAGSGEEALALCQQKVPDIVLLDVVMPGLDGFDVCQALKQEPKLTGTTVIFLSALKELEHRVKGLRVGGVDYITKPFEAAEVAAKLRTHLGIIELRRSLASKNQKLESLNFRLNEFLGMAAHDLRNPLATIVGAARLLKNDLDREARSRLLGLVERSSFTMRRLIDELLEISNLQSSQVKVRAEWCDLNLLLVDHLSLHEQEARRKTITIDIHQRSIPQSWSDPVKIGQIFDNLISNAVKYSPAGTTVRVELRAEGGQVHFSVSDQGPGISAEDIPKLFQPFGRIGTVPTGGEMSTGLGLAIVKRIVDVHGGTIEVDSSLGVGTRFSVTLPLVTQESGS